MKPPSSLGECRPQLVRRVRPPGTPGGGMFGNRARVVAEAESRTGLLDAEVARQKRVRIAECSHQDVARRPFADPGQVQQLLVGLGTVSTRVEREATARDR